MRYYEIKFRLSPDSQDARDILAAILVDAGFESFEDSKEFLTGYAQMDNFDKVMLDEHIEQFPIPEIDITYDVKEAEDKNWNEEWEQSGFEPIIIGKQCVIYDAKSGFSDNSFPISLAIDARQAFGTGTHETTQMIVSVLVNMDLKDKQVLDCGCGTGILSIVAAKKGAQKVVGYDIDDWSVRNSIHNAEINNVNIEVLEGDKNVLSHINGLFNVIVANINRNILLEDMPTLSELMNDSCTLIISGFYESDADSLIEKASSLGLKEARRLVLNNWCCLILNKV